MIFELDKKFSTVDYPAIGLPPFKQVVLYYITVIGRSAIVYDQVCRHHFHH